MFEIGVGEREVAAAMHPARLTALQAPRGRSAARADRRRRAGAASPIASRWGPACAQTASRVCGVGGSKAPIADCRRLAAIGLGDRRSRRAAAEHEALAERVRGEPVGAMEAGARALADGVEARQRRAALEVAGDPADQIVRRGRDRDRLARRDRARLPRRSRRRSGKRSGESWRRSSRTCVVSSASMRSRIAAVT